MGHKMFNLKAVTLALTFTMVTACSHSQVEEGADSAPPIETADQVAPPSDTDAIPLPAEVASAAPVAEDPNLAAQAPMPPADEAPAAPIELPPDVAQQAAPVDETSPAPAPVAEMPLQAPDPVVETPAEPAYASEPVAAPSNGEGTTYRVKKGDTLMKIAFEQYGDLYRWKEIYESNRDVIKDTNQVPPGTKLMLNGAGMVSIEKNGERYKIKNGDTLGTISKDVYGTTKKWKRLWENNRQLIKNPNRIYAGFYLFYQPDGRRLTRDRSQGTPESDGPEASNNAPAPGAQTAPDQRAPASK